MGEIDGLVVLTSRQAYLVTHVLAVFERLLRQGRLTPAQLALLSTGSGQSPVDAADIEMAEVVAEAAAPLRAQL
jgi:hypothetical protein